MTVTDIDAWIADNVLPRLPKSQPVRALELYAGMGRFTERLLPHVDTLQGVDIDEARENPAALPDGPFDLIVSFESSDCIDGTLPAGLWQSAASRLAPDGAIVVR